MSCGGFGTSFMGGCSMAWVGIAMIFLIIAFAKKWLFEEALSQDFNLIIGEAAGLILYIIIISFTGAMKWSLLAGLVVGLLGGYFGSSMTGGSSDSGSSSNSGF